MSRTLSELARTLTSTSPALGDGMFRSARTRPSRLPSLSSWYARIFELAEVMGEVPCVMGAYWPELSGEDRLAVRPPLPHRTEGFIGAFHGKDISYLRCDASAGDERHHVLHVLKRAHDRAAYSDLPADQR